MSTSNAGPVLADLHRQVVGYLKEGKFAEGINDFYAEDVIAQENTNPPVKGRATLVANEKEFLKRVSKYHGIEILATGIDDRGGGNGTVVYECVMTWEQLGKGEVTVEQAVVERWRNGKIQSIRFYGNFDPS